VSEPPDLSRACEALLAPRIEQRIVPGLDRIAAALAAFGNPEAAFPSVLVVGTNGKGSTSALLASVLAAHGLRVGRYTSPHLVRVEERIVVDGAPIAPDALLARLRSLEAHPELSYFETLTAAAFMEFAARRVDLAVLEAGLGGRWDATRAAPALVSLLTNVGTDHREWLGPTRTAIAAEKATALRGREAIVGAWDDEVRAAILAAAAPGTPVTTAAAWATVTGGEMTLAGTDVEVAAGQLACRARLPLAGSHQLDNLRLAIAGLAALAAHGLVPRPQPDATARGIAAVRWPGRLQACGLRGRRLLLDGAHNLEAMASLAAALDDLGLSGRVHLLFSCLDDKPVEEMARLLRPRAAAVTVTELSSPRRTPLADLAAAFPGCRTTDRLGDALAGLPAHRTTLVTGSLRLVGEVLSLLDGEGESPDGA